MTESTTRLAVIGGGNMAGAIARRLLASDGAPTIAVTTNSSTPSWVDEQRVHHRRVVDGPNANGWAVRDADAVILGVKPKDILATAREIASDLAPGALVVSVAAGVTLEQLSAALPDHAVAVRAMPNTPVAVGRGITAFAVPADAPVGSAQSVRELLAPTGLVEEMDEALIDGFSAVIGSGPAYIYYVMEALTAALDEQGLADDRTSAMVAELVAGAAAYLQADGREAAALRAEVTSPGGSTARAIGVFDERDVRGAISDGVRAAAMRARELGQ
ncbi:pyrroline-5-carboxylate reductase [Demequina sp. NBRC 110056]|uniref:pyrroline-5-carboxylate reductase n=1 Tax=Demequina sp. NBRC 110056 TaxID=1570345 RepID=UPI0009FE573F|nr:pyrroline-5-carboxylate reductase [Demequina sp. NBRC 110056]